MRWEKYNQEWRGSSPRFGSVKLSYSRKTKTWYLITNPWIGEGQVLAHGSKREMMDKAKG